MALPAIPQELITTFMDTFKTQAFLTKIGSGLASLKIQTPSGFQYVSEWINEVGRQTQINRIYLLVVLQAEQGLIESATVRNPAFRIMSLQGKPPFPVPKAMALRKVPDAWKPDKDRPALPGGWNAATSRIVRNGGPDFVDDGNWYVALEGDWKTAAALGVGIPDPGFFPAWDVRKYLGFPLQIKHAALLLRKYMDDFGKAVLNGTAKSLSVTVYSGETVVPADKETYAILQFNPDLEGLVLRPKIFAKYLRLATEWKLL